MTFRDLKSLIDMFAVCVIALLCLSLQPLDQLDHHQLEGSWVLVAAGLRDPAHLEHFKTRDSAIIKFASASEPSKISFTRIFGFNDSCHYLLSNITLEGSSFSFEKINITVTFLYTSCPDCVVMRFDNESKEPLRVYLFSKRREVEQKEMEEFGAQVACLNMLPPERMDPTKELCPENEEKAEGQKA
uniref:Uncharacterized protein n=1 Tax=Lates calcarifer TaxID=8187 RepID=A0A4W6FTU8_LATCA